MKLRAKAYLRIVAEDWHDKYEWVGKFYDGLAPVELEGKWGFVDQQGKEVVPLKYDETWSFFEGLARVKLNGKWGFIDKQGNEVASPKYDYVDVEDFSDDLVRVELDDKVGWVTREGKELLLTEDQHLQIKNLVELGKITEEQLSNWVKKRAI